jgi:methylthioribulose-1-phosphate dehydratase
MEPDRALVEPVVQKLVKIGRRLWERGFVEATSGNFSVKVADAPVRIVISATDVDKAALAPDDFLIVDGSGQPVGPATRKPSHETRLHVKVYAVVPGAGSVIHTHSPHAVALSRVVKKNVVSFRGLELAKAF